MSGFSAEWLALREPYDAKARNASVRDVALAAVDDLDPLAIVDLACGTGSTLRALAPLISARQTWRLVDNDLSLLARAADSMRPARAQVTATPIDLVYDLEAALDGAVDLVTTAASLDLVSAPWIERLTVECAARRLPLYAALSYDGRIAFSPGDPGDAAMVAAINTHQRSDKGFGPALGPAAADAAVERFTALGYSVTRDNADWVLGPADRAIQEEFLAGCAGAAREFGAPLIEEIAAWLTRRRAHVAAGRASIRVGHVDFFARPTAIRRAERSQSNSTSLSRR